jgi:ribose 5-phosphate isomerase B
MKMKLAIGCDHGGFELKKEVLEHLAARGIEVTDVGCNDGASCDYPVYSKKVTDLIQAGTVDLGILICGTGIGMSMAANKEPGIRAALCHDVFSAKATREHNNANVLCMGARVVGPGLALMIIDTFLDTPFSEDERHIRRISYFS